MPTLEDDDWDLDGQGEQVRPYQDWDMERDIDDLDEEFGGDTYVSTRPLT